MNEEINDEQERIFDLHYIAENILNDEKKLPGKAVDTAAEFSDEFCQGTQYYKTVIKLFPVSNYPFHTQTEITAEPPSSTSAASPSSISASIIGTPKVAHELTFTDDTMPFLVWEQRMRDHLDTLEQRGTEHQKESIQFFYDLIKAFKDENHDYATKNIRPKNSAFTVANILRTKTPGDKMIYLSALTNFCKPPPTRLPEKKAPPFDTKHNPRSATGHRPTHGWRDSSLTFFFREDLKKPLPTETAPLLPLTPTSLPTTPTPTDFMTEGGGVAPKTQSLEKSKALMIRLPQKLHKSDQPSLPLQDLELQEFSTNMEASSDPTEDNTGSLSVP